MVALRPFEPRARLITLDSKSGLRFGRPVLNWAFLLGVIVVSAVSLTMDEARTAAEAMSKLAERDERNEPYPRPDRLQALRGGINKLTAAMGKA